MGSCHERTPERDEATEQARAVEAWSRAQPADGALRGVQRIPDTQAAKPASLTASVNDAFRVPDEEERTVPAVPESTAMDDGWYHWFTTSLSPRGVTAPPLTDEQFTHV